MSNPSVYGAGSSNYKFFMILGIGSGIVIGILLAWSYYIYSGEQPSWYRSIRNLFRWKRNSPDDVESVPLRNWPTSSTPPPAYSVASVRDQPRPNPNQISKPKPVRICTRSAESTAPISQLRVKIEKKMAWQHGTLSAKPKVHSSLSTVVEEDAGPKSKRIGPPMVHPNMMHHITNIHRLTDRRQRKEEMRKSQAVFRFAECYKMDGMPPSPGLNGGPSRRSITSPITFSPTLERFSKAKVRSSVRSQHPGERVM